MQCELQVLVIVYHVVHNGKSVDVNKKRAMQREKTVFNQVLASIAQRPTRAKGLIAGAMMLCVALSHAQNFPTRPVRVVVPYPPGGPNDIVARIAAQRLPDIWQHAAVVDNRSGAGGNIGMELVARSAPDGYTVCVVSTAFVVNPNLYTRAGYDPVKDFVAVTHAASSALLAFAHPALPVRNMAELAKLAKTRPLNYASPSAGTTGHLGGELFNLMAGTTMQHIPYKGAAFALTDVMAGQVQIGITALPPAVPHVKSGALRGLGVTRLKREASLPDVPTVAEVGFPGYDVDNMIGIIAPAGTTPAVVAQLQAGFAKAIHAQQSRDKLVAIGFEPIAGTPAEFSAYIKSEMKKWSNVIKVSGAKIE